MVIGISGKSTSGKDAIAARLIGHWGFRIERFSDALKEEVLERLPRTLDALHEAYGHVHELTSCSFAQRPECIRSMVYDRKPRGVRELLQEYGTQVRRADSDSYWTDEWRRRAASGGLIVAPDVRFRNEADAIADAGGILWRVVRPGTATGDHISETELDGWRWWDAVLQNDGTLEDLWTKVDRLMWERRAAGRPLNESCITCAAPLPGCKETSWCATCGAE